MKKLLLLFTLVLIIQTTAALTISPLKINQTVNTTQQYTIDITYDNSTPHNFTIYNITLSDIKDFDISTIPNLTYLQTKPLTLTYTPKTHIDQIYIPKLQFFYITNATKTPKQINITITITGFSQSILNLNKNDTVQITNKDSITHTITNLNNNSQQNLAPDQAIKIKLTKDHYAYIDEHSSTGLIINTTTQLQQTPTINPNLFVPYNLPVATTLQKENLTIELIHPDDEIDYDESVTGFIVIRTNNNIGNIQLESDDWITFGRNNFDLKSDDAIRFNIKPTNITKTDQTNITYNKKIKVSGDNIKETVLPFNIKIKYFNFNTSSEAGTKFIYIPLSAEESYQYCVDFDWQTEACKQYEILFEKNNTIIQHVNRTFNPQITEKTIDDTLTAQQRLSEDFTIVKTRLEKVQDFIETTTTQLTDIDNTLKTLNERQTIVENQVVERQRDSNVLGIGLIITFILISVILITYGVYRYIMYQNYKENLKM